MRKWFGVFLIGALSVTMGAPTPAHALGAFAQWQNADAMDSGFGIGLAREIPIVPIVSVEGRVSYLHYGEGKGFASLDAFPLEAVGRVKFGMLYGGVGVGYYLFSGDASPKNAFGGSLLGGAEFTLFGLGAFAELRYLLLEPNEKDDSGFPAGTERDMSGFGASVGVRFPL